MSYAIPLRVLGPLKHTKKKLKKNHTSRDELMMMMKRPLKTSNKEANLQREAKGGDEED